MLGLRRAAVLTAAASCRAAVVCAGSTGTPDGEHGAVGVTGKYFVGHEDAAEAQVSDAAADTAPNPTPPSPTNTKEDVGKGRSRTKSKKGRKDRAATAHGVPMISVLSRVALEARGVGGACCARAVATAVPQAACFV